MKWFAGIKNIDELKKAYRDLCKKHHPDLGGNVADMQEINAEYESILREGLKHTENFKERMELEKELMDMVSRLIVLKGLIVEVCGRWIWITGETWRQKKALKALHCFWAPKKQAWYWRSASEKFSRSKQLPLEIIRLKYGSIEFETKEQPCLM